MDIAFRWFCALISAILYIIPSKMYISSTVLDILSDQNVQFPKELDTQFHWLYNSDKNGH